MPTVVLFVVIYVVTPAMMIWGWWRWSKRSGPATLIARVSFIGFLLANASALLALSSVLYDRLIGGFPHEDLRFLRVIQFGARLSLAGTVFA